MQKPKRTIKPKVGPFYWRVELLAVFKVGRSDTRARRAAGIVNGVSAGHANLRAMQLAADWYKSQKWEDTFQYVRCLTVQRVKPARMPILTFQLPPDVGELVKQIGSPDKLLFDESKP